ncbi:hypothetical protein H2203_007885 [Taxawa tesnikishii (nom. ined.)]|nr:hypothetical protein H2203_007885 [Dothideales sp. JES 119]
MRLSIPALSAFAATAFSQFFTPPFNTSQEYQLRTCLLPGQPAEKARFENLWLVASHTGAGLNDAVLYSNQSYAIRGFLNVTNTTQLNGEP